MRKTLILIAFAAATTLSLGGCASVQKALGIGGGSSSSGGSSSTDREAQLAAREQTKTTKKTGGDSTPRVTQSTNLMESNTTAQAEPEPELPPEPQYKANIKCDRTRERVTYTKREFGPGDEFVCYTFEYNETPPETMRGDVARYIELWQGDVMLHRHSHQDTYDGSPNYRFTLVPDPESQESKVFRKDWTGDFVRKLAALPPGKHKLELRAYIQQEEHMLRAATGEITYDNTNPPEGFDAETHAQAIDDNRGRDPEAELNAWIEANGGHDAWRAHSDAVFTEREAAAAERRAKNYYAVTLKNSCNDSLSVTTSNGRTFIMNPNTTSKLEVMRGSSASIEVVGRGTVGSVSEGNEGGSVSVCP